MAPTRIKADLLGPITLPANTTANAPLTFVAGSLLTTPAAGSLEFDGNAFYSTINASNRGVLPSNQLMVLSSTYTLTSSTSLQKLLNSTTNGQLTITTGTYEFECEFSLSSMSTTTGTFGWGIGGTATTTARWSSIAAKAALTTPATSALNFTWNTTLSNSALTATTTTATSWCKIRGILRCTAGGTIIPQVSLSVAAAAIVTDGSFFRIAQIGSSSMNNVGNWT